MAEVSKIVSLADVKKRKMIAQYVAFYGTTHDAERTVKAK